MPDNVPPNEPPEDKSKPEPTDAPEAPKSEPASPETPEAEAAAPPPPAPAPQSQNRSLMLVLSYLFLLALIPLLVEEDDAEVQWHAKNGLVWTAAWTAVWVALFVLAAVLPLVGWILGCLGNFVLIIGALIIHLLGMIKALNGERMRLPMLSDFADQWK